LANGPYLGVSLKEEKKEKADMLTYYMCRYTSPHYALHSSSSGGTADAMYIGIYEEKSRAAYLHLAESKTHEKK
jgi:hypothetical protein